MKKAQVTLLILVGLFVLIVSLVFIYSLGITENPGQAVVVESSNSKEFVEHCLNSIAVDALLTVGKQGGFAELQGDYFKRIRTSYLFDNGRNLVPEINLAEHELEKYIEAHFGLCTNNFEGLEKKGIRVMELSEPRADVIIGEKEVVFSVEYDLEEHRGGAVTRPEFLPTKVPVKLKDILGLANALVKSEQKNNEMFDLDIGCGLEILHFPVDKTLVTVITDKSFQIQNRPYRFVFAHKR